MPLIAATDYRQFIEVSRGSKIAADGGDPHPEALFHAVLAINPNSEPVRQIGNFAQLKRPVDGVEVAHPERHFVGVLRRSCISPGVETQRHALCLQLNPALFPVSDRNTQRVAVPTGGPLRVADVQDHALDRGERGQ